MGGPSVIRGIEENRFLENLQEADRFHLGVGKVPETVR
jgi:hypothetical protein